MYPNELITSSQNFAKLSFELEIMNECAMNHKIDDFTQAKMRRGFLIKEGDIVTLRAQPVVPRDVENIFR